jgi:hypothetical protein
MKYVDKKDKKFAIKIVKTKNMSSLNERPIWLQQTVSYWQILNSFH